MAILVVDDSKAMRMIVRRELRKAGYESTVEADNGAAALQAVVAGGVDLVLSDWNMPEMNGIELLEALRAGGHSVPFGFVTSESAVDIRLRAFEAGASFVVIKPFTAEDLRQQIPLALGAAPADVAKVAGGSEQSLAELLEGLLGRKVATAQAAPPRPDQPRTVAIYDVEGRDEQAYCVAELPLAAALGSALTRIPVAQAEASVKSRTLNEAMQANFYEIANVLSKLATTGSERCILRTVEAVAGTDTLDGLARHTSWGATMEVEVDGYPSGRLGFATVTSS